MIYNRTHQSTSTNPTRHHWRVVASFIGLAGLLGGPLLPGHLRADDKPVKQGSPDAIFFEAKIRPILANNCLRCHDSRQNRGDVRLDTRAFVASSRGGLLNNADAEKSKLIMAVAHTGAVKMPPGGTLRPDEIAALTEWVKRGAPWPEEVIEKPLGGGVILTAAKRNFWSFKPVKKPALPVVIDKSWVKSPIDAFILARLEKDHLKPAPPADRRSLIRRATVDLIGLTPTPEDVEAFVNDKSPNAWAKVIDRLLASPQYGERWGRRWLDLVRYADSNGLDENVAMAHAYLYRDYVVAAFNKDKPYNEFITEQLAGDMMPDSDVNVNNEHITATGFLTLGPKVLAEPDKEKMVMDIVDEQIEVTSKAFLGLTVACARCHDHKFDPIPTKDYYALAGIFKSTKSMETLNTVAKWNERTLTSATLDAERKAYEPKLNAAKQAVTAAKDQAKSDVLATYHKDQAAYFKAAYELAESGEPLSIAESPRGRGEAKRFYVEAEKFNRGNVGIDRDGYGKGIGIIHQINSPTFAEWDIDLPTAGSYQFEIRYASGEVRPVKFLLNGAVLKESACVQNTGSFFPDTQRWEVEGIFPFVAGKNTLRMECPGAIPHFDKMLIVAHQPVVNGKPARSAEQIAAAYAVDLVKLRACAPSAKGFPDPTTLDADALNKSASDFLNRIGKAFDQKSDAFLSAAQKTSIDQADSMLKSAEAKAPKPLTVMAVQDGKIEDCKVHVRGDTTNLGDVVPRHVLSVLCAEQPKSFDASTSGRLELAKWIADPAHPLTSRVAVNRIWQDHFGEGLVRTPDNWGLLGTLPTHPELLEWLAATFVEPVPLTAGLKNAGGASGYGCGWSFKRLHRLIMLSNTYKMSTVGDKVTAQRAATTDPDNKLLWQFNRRRMEAEPFRDSILFVAGKLDLTVGGTLLKTENHGYVTNDQSGNAAQYNAPRRSIYLPIIRNALFDMFQAFDVGDPSIVNARRSTTTIAPQALYVMNSAFVMDQSDELARILLGKKDLTDENRLDLAYRKMLGRPAAPSEISRLLKYISAYELRIPGTITGASKRHEKAWASACQALFASNEFIYLN